MNETTIKPGDVHKFQSKSSLLVLFVGARPCKLELLGANLVQSIPEGFLYDTLTIL